MFISLQKLLKIAKKNYFLNRILFTILLVKHIILELRLYIIIYKNKDSHSVNLDILNF